MFTTSHPQIAVVRGSLAGLTLALVCATVLTHYCANAALQL